ncbi:phosphopantothenoylcysteine decarboxylase subunit VHS3-like [Spinacia oleracea]|uniref:Phosphopantothenoylcysteine decarboxylase subunit VHS3-like n=1 Tax=Spinacia oleracea TaxID=3562 RepID=A0ABM3RIL8_SPIOL|nr:phosphopantothenoylcysteine decarboxylase subunit VHS3-like [Spinacia oleracea]
MMRSSGYCGRYDGCGGHDGGAREFEEYCDDGDEDNAECNVFHVNDDDGDDLHEEDGDNVVNDDDDNEDDDVVNEFPVNEEDDEYEDCNGDDIVGLINEDCNGDDTVGLINEDYIYEEPYRTPTKKIVKTGFRDEEEIAPPEKNMRFTTYK